MSISITINDINDLSDFERHILRQIASDPCVADVADTLKAAVRELRLQCDAGMPDTLKAAVRSMAGCGHSCNESGRLACDNCHDRLVAQVHNAEVLHTPAPTPAPAPGGATVESVATVPTPPAAPANPHLDANGLPWDKRIHSSSRAKVADGTWRYGRNLDKALIATVEAELRAVQAIPAPAPVAPTDDGSLTGDFMGHTQDAPAGWPFGTVELPSTDATLLEATRHDIEGIAYGAAVPVAPLPPTAPPAPTALPMTFAQLMQHVTPLLVSGKLTQPVLQQAVEACGLPHLAALGARPDLVETVKAAIDKAVGGVQ